MRKTLETSEIKEFLQKFELVIQPFISFIEHDRVLVEAIRQLKLQMEQAAQGDEKALMELNSRDLCNRILELIKVDYAESLRFDDESPEIYAANYHLSFSLLELKKNLEQLCAKFIGDMPCSDEF